MNTDELHPISKDLIDLNKRTFQAREYDLAYHALMAALHCARSLKHIPYLLHVQQIAKEELVWIDAHDPEYEHSTPSTATRSHPSIFHTLAVQANAVVTLLAIRARTLRAVFRIA